MDQQSGLTLQDRFISPKAVAHQLGLSMATVYRLLEEGEIPCIRAGRSYRIPARLYEEWLSKRQQAKDDGGL